MLSRFFWAASFLSFKRRNNGTIPTIATSTSQRTATDTSRPVGESAIAESAASLNKEKETTGAAIETAPPPVTVSPPIADIPNDFGHEEIYNQYKGQEIFILESDNRFKAEKGSLQVIITDPEPVQKIRAYVDGIVLSRYYGDPNTGSSGEGIFGIRVYYKKDGIEEGYFIFFYSSNGDSTKNAVRYLREPDLSVWYEIDAAAFDYLTSFFE